MRGGTHLRLTSVASSTSSGNKKFILSGGDHNDTFSCFLTSPHLTPHSAALPALESTQGYIVAISSLGGQLRFPGASDACISKHAINRLVEFIVLGKSPFPPIFILQGS